MPVKVLSRMPFRKHHPEVWCASRSKLESLASGLQHDSDWPLTFRLPNGNRVYDSQLATATTMAMATKVRNP